MVVEELDIPGCYQIIPNVFNDERGAFIKTYHYETFIKYGIALDIKEEFYSISKKNVLRGLHFQAPPTAHNKLVYCPKGAVLDFFVDIRVGSPTYGQSVSVELNEKNCKMLFLPVGIAHGFVSLLDNSLMVYKIDCSYDPKTDSGIRFDSCNVQLPIRNECLIVSSRDSSLVEWKDFESGFMYE